MAATAFYLTLSITPLQLLSRGESVSKATGFFLKHDEGWWLATNWHVLSGRHPITGQPLKENGATPDTCVFAVPTLVERRVTWPLRSLELGDALLGSARWVQHSVGQAVDVAAIQVEDIPTPPVRDLLDPDGHDDQMWVDLGGELFLPGYPLGITGGGGLPVWKRASLASSTEFGSGIDEYVLVDTATREGMSGAPCLAISNREYYRRAADSPRMTTIQKPLSWRLIGIYSGRINPSDSFEAQLGLVWRKDLLMQAIERGVPGSVILRDR